MKSFLEIINKLSKIVTLLLVAWSCLVLIQVTFWNDGFGGLLLARLLLFIIISFSVFSLSYYFLNQEDCNHKIKISIKFIKKYHLLRFIFWTWFLGYFFYAIIAVLFKI